MELKFSVSGSCDLYSKLLLLFLVLFQLFCWRGIWGKEVAWAHLVSSKESSWPHTQQLEPYCINCLGMKVWWQEQTCLEWHVLHAQSWVRGTSADDRSTMPTPIRTLPSSVTRTSLRGRYCTSPSLQRRKLILRSFGTCPRSHMEWNDLNPKTTPETTFFNTQNESKGQCHHLLAAWLQKRTSSFLNFHFPYLWHKYV